MAPKTLIAIQDQISNLRPIAHDLAVHVRKLKLVHKNRVAERQRMSDEGVPGSEEPFNTPLFDLEREVEFLIQSANEIKALSQALRNRKVEDWK